MKYLLALLTLASLTACGESLDLLVVSVEPETRTCYDSSTIIDAHQSVRHIDTLECRTGREVTKWVWE